MVLKIFIILTIWACGIYGEDKINDDIIAYDCAHQNVEIKKISLLDIEPCVDPSESLLKENKSITLVQQKQYTPVQVYSCHIQVQQIIQHCGMHSHTSAVDEGFSTYIQRITEEECMKLHSPNSRYLVDLRKIHEGLSVFAKPNSTVHTSATIKGSLDSKGNCNGVKFSYNGVDYKDVIVVADITIKLRDYQAMANIEQNSVMLRNGLRCAYSTYYCYDDEDGEVTWKIADQSTKCSINNFDVLYKGQATLLTLTDNKSKYIIVESNKTIFALNLISQESICNHKVWRTEQTRLGVIFETTQYYDPGVMFDTLRNPGPRFKLVDSQNVNMYDQILTKLLYLEIAIKTEQHDLIYESIRKRCLIRENILRNRLALAYSSPDVVSTLVEEASGHIGRIMGEVLYVVRCVRKNVKYRPSEKCYQELPITYKNQPYFRTPITHIIQKYGTQINCDKNMPAMVRVGKKWMQFNPKLKLSSQVPFKLNANNPNETVPAIKITPINSNGLFTTDELENFRESLLFPNEREAIDTIVARRILGVETEGQGFSFPNIFDSSELREMAEKIAKGIWGILTGIMKHMHEILITMFILFFVKYLIGVICNYFMLKSATTSNPIVTIGASFWNILTRLLLFRSSNKAPENEEDKDKLSSTNHSEPLLNKSSNSATIV